MHNTTAWLDVTGFAIVSKILFLGRNGGVAVGFVKWDGDETRYYDENGKERTQPGDFYVFKEIGYYCPTEHRDQGESRLCELLNEGRDDQSHKDVLLPTFFYN